MNTKDLEQLERSKAGAMQAFEEKAGDYMEDAFMLGATAALTVKLAPDAARVINKASEHMREAGEALVKAHDILDRLPADVVTDEGRRVRLADLRVDAAEAALEKAQDAGDSDKLTAVEAELDDARAEQAIAIAERDLKQND